MRIAALFLLAAVARYPLHSFQYDVSRATELGMTFRPIRESLKSAADWFVDKGYARGRKR